MIPTLLVLLGIVVILILLPGRTPAIAAGANGAKSIASLEPIVLGGARQWILIRSEDTRNPVVLFLHGGPGTSQLGLNRKCTRSLERHFIVVNWDQRGAGKSFAAARDAANMTMDRIVADTIELAEHLAARFGRKTITLVGHSWGSAIGVLAAAKRPDLFDAYVGIGQMSNALESEKLSYAWTLQQAAAAGDAAAVRTLTTGGPPPYTGDWQAKFMTQRRILGKYGGEYYGSRIGAFGVVLKALMFSPEYTVMDRINFFRGIFRSVRLLFPELLTVNLFERVPTLDVPVWFMLGRHDREVPSQLSEKYFAALAAPSKQLHWFEHSAHMPNTEEREEFNRVMVDDVRSMDNGQWTMDNGQ